MSITKLNKLKKAYQDARQAEESNCDGDGAKRIDWYDRRINEINQELSRKQLGEAKKKVKSVSARHFFRGVPGRGIDY